MGFGGSSSAAGEIESQQRSRQKAIQDGTRNIDEAFSGFDPNYYEGIRQNVVRTLTPQFNRQLSGARKGLVYGLANKGLLKSSTAREAATDLAIEKGTGEMEIANRANEAVRSQRANVEQAKTTATNQLITSQDPALAAQQAVAGASQVFAPSAIAPIGNLVKTFTDTWAANRLAGAYAGGGQQVISPNVGGGAPLPKNYVRK